MCGERQEREIEKGGSERQTERQKKDATIGEIASKIARANNTRTAYLVTRHVQI